MDDLDLLLGGNTAKDHPAEHIAAIAAAVAAIYTDIPEEHIAVIAAALAAYEETVSVVTVPIVKICRGSRVWSLAGRQEVMAARKFQ